MACTFTIEFTATPAAVISNIQTRVLANNGTFAGDNTSGNFSVPVPTSHIEGAYNIIEQQITLDITNKPFFLSCSQIQDYVQSNLIAG
jgi:hypothetical protein